MDTYKNYSDQLKTIAQTINSLQQEQREILEKFNNNKLIAIECLTTATQFPSRKTIIKFYSKFKIHKWLSKNYYEIAKLYLVKFYNNKSICKYCGRTAPVKIENKNDITVVVTDGMLLQTLPDAMGRDYLTFGEDVFFACSSHTSKLSEYVKKFENSNR